MGYIGATPSNNFINTDVQRITGSTNNYIDLDHSISSLDSVIVYVNNVRQESTNLTFTSASRITLGDTLTSSDVCEVIFLGKAVATQTPDTGTVTNDMLAGSIANSKLANSSITLNGSAVSLGGSATVANTPSFEAKTSSDVDVTSGVTTKVQFDTELFDTDSCYDHSTNYRFTPNVAGKYYIWSIVGCNSKSNANLETVEVRLYKNGSWENTAHFDYRTNNARFAAPMVASVITFNGSSDYVESYVNIGDSSGNPNTQANYYSRFGGYRIIGA